MTAAHRRTTRGRRYRGEHHDNGNRWLVAELAELVAVGAEQARYDHIASLRRPFNPNPIYLDSVLWTGKFYGVVPDCNPNLGTVTLTIERPGDVLQVPALTAAELSADDAPTGPIMLGHSAGAVMSTGLLRCDMAGCGTFAECWKCLAYWDAKRLDAGDDVERAAGRLRINPR